VVLRPTLVGVAGSDFSARMKAIQAGRDAALAMLTPLKQRMAALTR